jgi:homoserine O-acetyltransferase
MKAGVVFIAFGFAVGSPASAQPPPLEIAELGDLELASGGVLHEARIGYRTAGTLDPERTNVILFPTWFSGTTEDLFRFGTVDLVDTSRFFLVAVDALGNGVSSSPSTSAKQPGESFPRIGIQDMVRSQHRLLVEVLGISRLHAVVGISMGGMQVFDWIVAYPEMVERAVPIVGSPRLGAYDVLLWETELEAIALGRGGSNEEGAKRLVGLIGELALRTPAFHARETARDEVAGLLAQAKAGGLRMDLDDRAAQLRAMIEHDVSRPYGGSLEQAAARVEAEVLNVVGTRDHMVTPGPALDFAELVGAGSLELESDCGHLAPSCEIERLEKIVRRFLAR